jgi:hypothetical protein
VHFVASQWNAYIGTRTPQSYFAHADMLQRAEAIVMAMQPGGSHVPASCGAALLMMDRAIFGAPGEHMNQRAEVTTNMAVVKECFPVDHCATDDDDDTRLIEAAFQRAFESGSLKRMK